MFDFDFLGGDYLLAHFSSFIFDGVRIFLWYKSKNLLNV